MFGGYGMYVDGLICGLVADGRLYLKTDADTQAAFTAAGCAPFVYEGMTQPIEMSYWSVPEAALESAEEMGPWLKRAVEAAGRKAASKKPVAKKGAKKPARKAAQKKPTEQGGKR